MNKETKAALDAMQRFTKSMRQDVRGEHDVWAKGWRQASKEMDNAIAHIRAGRDPLSDSAHE